MTLPPPLPAGTPAPARPGWWQRHWKWAVPLISLATLLVLGGAIFAFVSMIAGAMRDNDVYRIALARTRADAAVVAALGTPIEPDWLFTAQMNTGAGVGHAHFEIPVEGPRGRATIFAHAHSELGVWKFAALATTIEGSTTPIDLMPGLPPDRRLSADQIEAIEREEPSGNEFDGD